MPITYKCPSCGSAMEFDATTQKLSCAHCGYNVSVEEFEKNNSKENDNGENNNSHMKVYHCQSCGAELVTDEYTSATICSFCGNPGLVEDRLEGEFSPSTVIPFKINKEQAQGIYKDWVKKGPLTPRSLASNSTIEKLTGMYVPYWLYDFEARDKMEANATRVRVERHGDYRYTYTDHYRIYRDVDGKFEKIPADASEKMPDDAMDKLEPFLYEDLVPFQQPYLSGYLSERYNYTPEEMADRATNRATDYITNVARDSIAGYAIVNVVSNMPQVNKTSDQYALLPVWVLNYRFKGENRQFFLNGQTGKIVADRPVSMQRALAIGSGIFAGIFTLLTIGGLFIW